MAEGMEGKGMLLVSRLRRVGDGLLLLLLLLHLAVSGLAGEVGAEGREGKGELGSHQEDNQ